VVGLAWDALQQWNSPPQIFRVAAAPMRLERDDSGAALLRPLTKERVRYVLAQAAQWEKIEDEEIKIIWPPAGVVDGVLARPDPPLPVLTRIVAAPIFAMDGTLLDQPGYHAAGCVYYDPRPGTTIPPIPVTPSDVECIAAKRFLCEEVLGDFPFVAPADTAHALSFGLLPFIRDLVNGFVPLHVFTKPSPGTGAGLLVDVLTIPALGTTPARMTESNDENELRKRFLAALLGGPAVLLIDNVHGRLDSAVLNALLTSERFEDRLLGKTEMGRPLVRAIFGATGNNVALSHEVARRIVPIVLDAKIPHPETRSADSFRHPDLRTWVREHRGELIWASCVLVRAWLAAGRPRPTGLPAFGEFEAYAEVVGGILQHAGIPGFLANRLALGEQADVEGAAWREFVAAWWERHGTDTVTTGDLWPLTMADDAIPDPKTDEPRGTPLPLGLRDGSPHSLKVQLGLKLSGFRDKPFGGYIIRSVDTFHRAQRWRLDGPKG
jgi:hypothetical protein